MKAHIDSVSDPKKLVGSFITENYPEITKIFDSIIAQAAAYAAAKLEKPPGQHINVAMLGFPCQPYSSKRNGRFDTAKPEHHDKFMEDEVVKVLQTINPDIVLLEQVMGFHKHSANEAGLPTPCERFTLKLRQSGMFTVRVWKMDGQIWIKGFRANRTRWLGQADVIGPM